LAKSNEHNPVALHRQGQTSLRRWQIQATVGPDDRLDHRDLDVSCRDAQTIGQLLGNQLDWPRRRNLRNSFDSGRWFLVRHHSRREIA
jgi:hypothetical protein